MAPTARGCLGAILDIAETAFWTFIFVIMLILVFGIAIWAMLLITARYPQIPAEWFWPVIWIFMGLVLLGLLALYLWWDRVLKDRESLNNL